jgi:hypothetical protein
MRAGAARSQCTRGCIVSFRTYCRLVAGALPCCTMRWLKLLLLGATVALVSSAAANAATPTPLIRVDEPYAMTIRVLDESAGKYQVEIDNANPLKFVSSFNWTPPSGMNVTSITSSIGGRCHLTGDGVVVCTGAAAPANSVTTMGGEIIVNFIATGRQPTWTGSYWIHYGVIGSVQVQQSTFSDLPACKKGQRSTRAHPCATL